MQPSIELQSRTVSFREDLNVLVVRWHSLMPLEVVQADYEQILLMAQAHGTSVWLLDVRRRASARPEVAAWLTTTFFPYAATRLAPQRLRLAVLNSPALSQSFKSDPEHRQRVDHSQHPSRPFDLRLFEDEGEAMQWLSTAPQS